MEYELGAPAVAYTKWAAKMAVDLGTGVPWIMCKQDDAPDPIVSIAPFSHLSFSGGLLSVVQFFVPIHNNQSCLRSCHSCTWFRFINLSCHDANLAGCLHLNNHRSMESAS